MDRRANADQPSSWQEVVELGVGVARAVLGAEPKRDPRPWVRGGEAELLVLDREVPTANGRKRWNILLTKCCFRQRACWTWLLCLS